MDWNVVRKRVAELRRMATELEAMLPHEEDISLEGIEIIEDAEVIDAVPFQEPKTSFFDDISAHLEKVLSGAQ